MKYTTVTDGFWDYQRYLEYLGSHSDALSALVSGDKLIHSSRFEFGSSDTFHDARMIGLEVRTSRPTNLNDATARFQLSLRLKGPYFDREFRLQYVNAWSSSIDLAYPTDDLMAHEVRLIDEEVEHEMVFMRGNRLLIRAERMEFHESFE